MITEKQCKKIIDIALEHGKGRTDGVEAEVFASDVATSRFANNGMTQNQAPEATGISVRVLLNGRQTRLSSGQTSPDAVRKLVDRAIAATKLLEPDTEMLPLYDPSQSTHAPAAVNRYDAKTARMTPADRATKIQQIIKVAKDRSLSAAGVYTSGTNVHAIGNSNGLFLFHRETEAECSLTMTAANSSGWAKAQCPSGKDIDVQAMALSAADKAIGSANPIDLPAGDYTVILEPSAVLDLLGYLWYDFSATSHIDQLSCFLGQVGKKVLGDNITIYDDVLHPLQAGATFDGEGLPTQKVTLVENGVIKNLVYGRRAAKKLGAQPTGHGLQEPNAEGESPSSIVIAGGNTSLEEMIKTTDRGILLTRVWYVRQVDPTTQIVTGMTRDGTFLVENGKIKAGIKNLRFNESLIEMLKNVIAMGPSVRAAGEESAMQVVPSMKVGKFHFSSGTEF